MKSLADFASFDSPSAGINVLFDGIFIGKIFRIGTPKYTITNIVSPRHQRLIRFVFEGLQRIEFVGRSLFV